MSYDPTTRENAAKAAEHLRTYGWIQGHLGSPGAPCCAMGAMAAALPHSAFGPLCSHLSPLWDAVQAEIGTPRIDTWNDTPGRTAEEVIAVFDRIAQAP